MLKTKNFIKFFILISFLFFWFLNQKNWIIFAGFIENSNPSEIFLDDPFLWSDWLVHVFLKWKYFDKNNEVAGLQFELNFDSEKFEFKNIKNVWNFNEKIIFWENFYLNWWKIFFIWWKNISNEEKNFLELENNEKFLEIIFNKKEDNVDLNINSLNLGLENFISWDLSWINVIKKRIEINNNKEVLEVWLVSKIIKYFWWSGWNSWYRWFDSVLNNFENSNNLEKNQNVKNTKTLELKEKNNKKIFKINFLDIEKHWAKDFIEELTKKNIFDNSKNFNPEKFLTRIDLLKIVIKWFDLLEENWENWDFRYSKYLSKSLELWILDKNIWENLRLWDFVNRAEAMKIILKASWIKDFWVLNNNSKQNWDNFTNFKDIKKWIWFEKYVNFAYKNWIISWYWNWNFWPENFLTRWEVAKIIFNSINILKK